MRLGVYTDLIYRVEGDVVSTDRAFIRFPTNLPPRIEEIVLFGRLDPTPGRSPYALPTTAVRLVPLPYYERVDALGPMLRGAPGSCIRFNRELATLDAVWIFGPHPLALMFALQARARRTPLVLGVRQDYPAYIANRLPSPRWRWAVTVARALERAFLRLAAKAPVVALGDELASRYAQAGGAVLSTGFSLVSAAEIVSLEETQARPWENELRLLSVGRLDPEKNPLLLLDVFVRLREREPRWRLTVAGEGPLRGALERRAAELGIGDELELLGYVPNGARLWQLYRSSHVFLHVSLTEGLPQVVFEAQAAGLPIVATDVGGVGAAVASSGGLLVPPNDAEAAVAALSRVASDSGLRRTLIEAGLAAARAETMERQLDRVAEFIGAHVRAPTSVTASRA
jgi:glycosyltransferase involved in cell wall biosynthesis